MNRIIRSLVFLLIVVVSGIGATAQTSVRYNVEDAVLIYYYAYLCSEQGSLASMDQQKEFAKRGFYKKDLSNLFDPFLPTFLDNLHLYNEINDFTRDFSGILWEQPDGAEYFTLYFDDIKFLTPTAATVKAHIDYGVSIVPKVYKMRKVFGEWLIEDISVANKPLKFLSEYNSDYRKEYYKKLALIQDSKPVRKNVQAYDNSMLDEAPEFPGGYDAMNQWIDDNIQYPAGVYAEGVTGKVRLELVIDYTGKVTDSQVIYGIHNKLDEEALRVVNSMPAWKPGKICGMPVSSRCKVCVEFGLRQWEKNNGQDIKYFHLF